MIASTAPGMAVPGRPAMRPVSRFRCVILADLAMRGLAISRLTLARVASLAFLLVFLAFLCRIPPSSQLDANRTAPFRTLVEFPPDFFSPGLSGGSASASRTNSRSTPCSQHCWGHVSINLEWKTSQSPVKKNGETRYTARPSPAFRLMSLWLAAPGRYFMGS